MPTSIKNFITLNFREQFGAKEVVRPFGYWRGPLSSLTIPRKRCTKCPSIALKRAGFVGMRGKKSMPYETEDEESEMGPVAKRAGFVGMRGKKAGKGGASLPSDALSAAKYYHKFDSWPYYLIPYASKARVDTRP